MKDFQGRIAVITGGGSGIGQALAIQLAEAGCHISLCDLSEQTMADTVSRCRKANPNVTVSAHACDVADENSVLLFRDQLLAAQKTDHVHLVFSNAGIGGGGSFINGSREDWERTFAVCWYGVYYVARTFVPLLMAADEGHLINTSSVNGFWASIGPDTPHTAYSAAKFAVKGFSEALITELRLKAPHVHVSVVMPGHIGTNIALNTRRILGLPESSEMPADEVARMRKLMMGRGMPVDNLTDDAIRQMAQKRLEDFRDSAPTSPLEAATVILDGVRENRWRILVGGDAHALDRHVRATPEEAYEASFLDQIHAEGHLQGSVTR